MRTRRALPAVTTAALLLAAAASPAAGLPSDPEQLEVTLLATTDVHGHVYDWDYFRNQPFPDASASRPDSLGLTRLATAVAQVRAEKGEESVVLVDNGDAIQGTPLTYYYGMGAGRQAVLDDDMAHPMAAAFNYLDYDVQTVGNHEYNYGLDLLSAYEEDLDFPLLGANVLEAGTEDPYHQPYELIERTIDGEQVTIGVIGMVTPGVRIWDKQYVDGVLEFQDMLTAAERWVPVVDDLADVVVVIAHTGDGTVPDAAYDRTALHEDVTGNIARQVPGIDVIVAGHSHQNVPQRVFTNTAGEQVLMTQPNFWARSVTETTLNLVPDADGGWQVDWSEGNAPTAVPHTGLEHAEDPGLSALLAPEHATTVDYVNTPVAESVTELPASTSRYEDTAIIDFINHVQQTTVEAALTADQRSARTVISQASPFSRTAVFPQGEVTIRDIAGLYIYENTLRAVELTGAQLRDYLEYSARYFNQVEEGAPFDPETGTNAVYDDRPEGVPDYNYDAISGLDYHIDISQPVGERIGGLSYPDGTPVGDDDLFVLAVNNYRQSGGGAFPHVAQAPVVYDEQQEIRQLLIEWAQERGVIDPSEFFVENWRLVTEPVAAPEPAEPPAEEPVEVPVDDPTTPQPPTDSTAQPGTGATTPPAGGAGEGRLPSTGAPVTALAGLTVLAVLAGAAALVQRRRMESSA
ncbi:bifunctional metallophosphatase/5'-nucleotidase [Georgenia wutianyii]|uniref:bifunctional metallophosphatase/5'-nucleotidase n=1 Tax=Georgenia wutianyii TaxID=2585135 RepID=UPI0015D3DDB9|nr:5'-nucleotidase C-terminal domain-containing protein [Georgenia wutianyii]